MSVQQVLDSFHSSNNLQGPALVCFSVLGSLCVARDVHPGTALCRASFLDTCACCLYSSIDSCCMMEGCAVRRAQVFGRGYSLSIYLPIYRLSRLSSCLHLSKQPFFATAHPTTFIEYHPCRLMLQSLVFILSS